MSASRVAAMVMAGGAGSRMSRSGGHLPKPLMPVRGIPLLEYNVAALRRHGLEEIYIAVPVDAPAVGACATALSERLATTGCGISVIEEREPLGSMGAAAFVDDGVETLLVVNADNLTDLDLTELLAHHERAGADITLAVHAEPFHMPFGEISTDGTRVVGYVEKPTYDITISSALTVVGARARRRIAPGDHEMLPSFVQGALAAGLVVEAHRHAAHWVDVNDLDALHRAEAMVSEYPDAFDIGALRG